MTTTLYNHNRIETDQKPLILNLQFKEACERIKQGEQGVKEDITSRYSLVPAQITLLNQLTAKFTTKQNI
jgi:hypothetical protein